MFEHFFNVGHLQQIFIVVSNISFDDAFEHFIRIESVAAIFIYIFQDSAVGIVTDKNIMKIIADVACQHRTAYIHFPGFWIINKIIRVRHNGIMKNSLTGFYSFFDSSAAVIFPFPFVTVQCGFTENGINQLWVITSTKCNHRAKGKIRFRSTLKFCDIPSIIKTDKFFAIFIFTEATYDIKTFLLSFRFRMIVYRWFANHILF